MPQRFSEVLKQGCNMLIPEVDCQKSPCIKEALKSVSHQQTLLLVIFIISLQEGRFLTLSGQ